VEGQAEQALLSAPAHAVGDVEEGPREKLPALDDPDTARLLHHEESVVAGVPDVDRIVETGEDGLEADRARPGRGGEGGEPAGEHEYGDRREERASHGPGQRD
jgi:hypothetical protein